MAFWSDLTLEPKRQFKFKVTFPNLNNGAAGTESTFLAQSADRPSYKIGDSAKVHYLDKEFTFPGKITWEPVKITFVDAVGDMAMNVAKRSYDYLAQSGWVRPDLAGGILTEAKMKTISKAGAVNTAQGGGFITVQVLGSDGRAVDTWTLKNAFVTNVVYNGLDYKAEEILTAQYTIRFDWADFFSPIG